VKACFEDHGAMVALSAQKNNKAKTRSMTLQRRVTGVAISKALHCSLCLCLAPLTISEKQ